MLRILTLTLTLAFGSPANANTLSQADYQRIDDFMQRMVDLPKDMAAVIRSAGSSSSKECLLYILSALRTTVDEIVPVRDLVELDWQMIDPADEAQVIDLLRIDVRSFMNGLAIERQYVNARMGGCASNGVAAAKDQAILNLFDEAADLVREIDRKIGVR